MTFANTEENIPNEEKKRLMAPSTWIAFDTVLLHTSKRIGFE